MADTLRIGIVGAGKIVRSFHLPAWAKVAGARVVAIADPRIDAATELAAAFGIGGVHASFGAMIDAGGLDAVDICSPHVFHADQAVACLDAGLHCIVEKPMATDSAGVLRIADAAARAGRQAMCAQHQRFRPPSVAAERLIAEGRLGTIYHGRAVAIAARGVPAQIANSFTDRAQSGGGPLIDQGAHVLDLAWWLMGRPAPLAASAVAGRWLAGDSGATPNGAAWTRYDVEDHAVGLLRFAGGRSLSVEASYLLNAAADAVTVELHGTAGGLLWPEMRLTLPDGDGVSRETVAVDDTTLASVAELAHFVDLARGRAAPRVPLADTVTVMRMIEALYRSAAAGREVAIDGAG